jgi:hypothetical protein
VAKQSKARVCRRSFGGICGLKLYQGHGFLFYVSAVYYKVVSVTGQSLVQRNPADCGVSSCVT